MSSPKNIIEEISAENCCLFSTLTLPPREHAFTLKEKAYTIAIVVSFFPPKHLFP